MQSLFEFASSLSQNTFWTFVDVGYDDFLFFWCVKNICIVNSFYLSSSAVSISIKILFEIHVRLCCCSSSIKYRKWEEDSWRRASVRSIINAYKSRSRWLPFFCCSLLTLFFFTIIYIHFAVTNWPTTHPMQQWAVREEKVLPSSSLRIVCCSGWKSFYHRHFILNLACSFQFPHSSSSEYTQQSSGAERASERRQQQLTTDNIMKSLGTTRKSLQHIVWRWIWKRMEMIQPRGGVCLFALSLSRPVNVVLRHSWELYWVLKREIRASFPPARTLAAAKYS